MAPRPINKRTLEEVAAAEDSNDDDYDDNSPGPSRKRASKKIRRGPPAKRQRRGAYAGSDVDSDDDDILEDDEDSFGDESEEELPVETNERGRPVRGATKKATTYAESDSEEDELSRSSSEEQEPLPRAAKERKSLRVTLKMTPGRTLGASTRNTRTRSGSSKPLSPSGAGTGPKRRSSRLSHDPDDDLVALTNSGNHVAIVRPGSREPDDISVRPTRGGKGIKYPSKSTIDEESESVPKEEETDELEIKASQHELLEADAENGAEFIPQIASDIQEAADAASEDGADVGGNEDGAEDAEMQEAGGENDNQEDDDNFDDDDDVPVRRGRPHRGAAQKEIESPVAEPDEEPKQSRGRSLRNRAQGGASQSRRRKAQEESSDFDPEEAVEHADELSSSGESDASPRKNNRHDDEYESSQAGRRSTRLRGKASRRQSDDSNDELAELAEEVEDLQRETRRKRSRQEPIVMEEKTRSRRGVRQPQSYNLMSNFLPLEEEDDQPAPSPSQRPRKQGGAGTWQRSLFSVYGPFGGAGGPPPVFGGPAQPRAQGDVDSDSSDDEVMKQPKPVGIGGTVGMTPTTAGPVNLFPQLNQDAAQATGGAPANLGKVKEKQALADADPLGVDQFVNFDSVGGLQGHIDQLKEMVALPLLYPEIFMRFKVTPPRGVLFHGPPGTGKTLLARALATSVSSQGKKVTFYMRKGADALSKWVGEAERQLRLLFDEARKNQPSIIFFDEIDGLAPVRSSKQEQIHASIVSTLLALMDGMDGRGQVIVIGATNRPDSVDPALRRPGRFDREFYFPLPNRDARRAILDIHTKGWDPPLPPTIKDELAELTKGYGGADLRALCTEAALNAVQRHYPQIYSSNEKLVIDPKTIEVTPKDFMISIKKMTPSSERSASSGAMPLPPSVAPLLQTQLQRIRDILAEVLPQKKKLTALEEAQYEDGADGQGFGREMMQQAFESARVFRPRLLVQGKVGMGQQYLAAALLNYFEGLHVQSFDLPTLLNDTATSPESTVIRLFSEVKMHKPSVIYISNVQDWYATVGPTVISTFLGLLRSIKPTDAVLLLGFQEGEAEEIDEHVRRELFGYSKKNQFQLRAPANDERLLFFQPLKDYIKTAPTDFPDPANRKKRHIEDLPVAPPEVPKEAPRLTKQELKAQKSRDRHTLNLLKTRLQPIMDQIRMRYKIFRNGPIDEADLRYLFEEADPGTVTSDLNHEILAQATFRPYELAKDKKDVTGVVDGNGRFFYNLDSVTIEKRLQNGYYKRARDFYADIKRLLKDAKNADDPNRILKASELVTNVDVDIQMIETQEPALVAECERVYLRELAREKEFAEQARKEAEQNNMPPPQLTSNVPHGNSSGQSTDLLAGPITLGVPIPRENDLQQLSVPKPDPLRAASHSTGQTNGVTPTAPHEEAYMTNGTDIAMRGDLADVEVADVGGDVPMGGTDSHLNSHERSHETQKTHTTSSFGNRESAQPRPFHTHTAPSQQAMRESGMSQPRSQTGYITPLVHGSRADEYQNDASTTQSSERKRISSDSNHHAGNTQESGPNLYLYEERRSTGGSEIPDTQAEQPASQPSAYNAPPSQPPAPSVQPERTPQPSATPRSNGLLNLLNPPSPPAPHNLVMVSEAALDNFHADITDKTTGLSVEQLEQVNSVLMDAIWRSRGEWDRNKVLAKVGESFNEVLKDMVEIGQEFGESSWGQKQR